jgi:CRP-like cAMP-binding protein
MTREIGEVLVRHLGLIGELSAKDEDALLSVRGEIRDLQRGEDVLTDVERPAHSVVVIDGLLQRYTVGPQGKRQIHSFYIPTDTPSLEAVHIGVMDNNLGALTPSRVGLVPLPELHRLMGLRPNVLSLIWRETLVQAAILRAWLMRNSRLLPDGQMAHLFCETVARAKAAGLTEGDSCDLPVTHEDLADALGMPAVHVNRTLTMLRAARLAEFQSGRLTILNWNQLVDIAEFDSSYLHLRQGPNDSPRTHGG